MSNSSDKKVSPNLGLFQRVLQVHFASGKDISADESNFAAMRENLAAHLFQKSISPSDDISQNALLNELNALNQQQSGEAMPLLLIAELRFGLYVLDAMVKVSQLSAQTYQLIGTLRYQLLAYALLDGQFWFQPNAYKKWLALFYKSGLGLPDKPTGQSEKLNEALLQSVQQVKQHSLGSTEDLFAALSGLNQALKISRERVERLLTRLIETESGAMKLKAAEAASIEVINTILQAVEMTEDIHQFLVTDLRFAIQQTIMEQGYSSQFDEMAVGWQKLLVLLKAPPEKIDQQVYGLIEKLKKHCLPLAKTAEQRLEETFREIYAKFLNLSQGDAVQGLASFELIESDFVASKQVSASMKSAIASFQVGQWFVFKEAGVQKRVQLVLHLEQFNQYLFADANGAKELSCDGETFAMHVSSKVMIALSDESFIDRTLKLVLNSLLKNISELEQAHNDKLKQQAMALEQKKQALSLEKQKREESEKARVEAERIKLAQEQAKREHEALLAEKAQAEKSGVNEEEEKTLRRQIKLTLDSLLIGSWITYVNPETLEEKRLKLVLRFAATNKFMFANAEGVTEEEFIRDDLIELVLNEQVKLLEGDKLFADRLAKIVGKRD